MSSLSDDCAVINSASNRCPSTPEYESTRDEDSDCAVTEVQARPDNNTGLVSERTQENFIGMTGKPMNVNLKTNVRYALPRSVELRHLLQYFVQDLVFVDVDMGDENVPKEIAFSTLDGLQMETLSIIGFEHSSCWTSDIGGYVVKEYPKKTFVTVGNDNGVFLSTCLKPLLTVEERSLTLLNADQDPVRGCSAHGGQDWSHCPKVKTRMLAKNYVYMRLYGAQ